VNLLLTGLACGLALLVRTASAFGQVNVEPLRAQVKDKGFGARVAFSAAGYAGNTQGMVLGSSGFVGFHSVRHLAYMAASGNFAKLGGVVSIANWFAHVRHDYELGWRVSWEAFAQLESDRFRRITWRELLGTGPRFMVVKEEPIDVFLATAYMYEYTTLSGSARRESGGVHRSSSYVAMSLRAHPKIVLTSVTYVQPRIDDPSDLRVLSVLDADLEVTKRLHSRISSKYRYDSLPPADVRSSDFELASALELQF
jgi:hypothetical protein